MTKAWRDKVVGSLKKACIISVNNGQNCQENLKLSKLSSSSWWVRHSLQMESWSFLSFFLLCWRNPNIQNSEKAQATIQGSFGIKGWSSMKKNEVLIEPTAAKNAEKRKKRKDMAVYSFFHKALAVWGDFVVEDAVTLPPQRPRQKFSVFRLLIWNTSVFSVFSSKDQKAQ